MIKHFAKKVEYEIPRNLKGLVVAIIIGESDKEIDLTVPIFATGFPLIVNIFGDRPTFTIDNNPYKTVSNLIVAGQIYNSRIVFRQTGTFGNVGIILHPTAPYYLFRKPGAFFNNMWTGFRNSSPLPCSQLMEELSASTTNDHRIHLILLFLIQLEKHRFPAIPWLEKSINLILLKNGQINQAELIQEAGISIRHFRRVFKKVVGVPPKYFCKVIQINTVFQLLHDTSSEKMHLLALDCGYYDQAHFINDFNKLIGDTPQNFLHGDQAFLKEYMGRQRFTCSKEGWKEDL